MQVQLRDPRKLKNKSSRIRFCLLFFSGRIFRGCLIHYPYHPYIVYLPTWTVDFYGFHVDNYIYQVLWVNKLVPHMVFPASSFATLAQVRSRSTSQLLEPWGLADGDLWMLSWLSILDKKMVLPNPAPVEVGSLPYYLQGFLNIPGGAKFLPSTVFVKEKHLHPGNLIERVYPR